MHPRAGFLTRSTLGVLLFAGTAVAQTSEVVGVVRDETGGLLPGVVVELTMAAGPTRQTATDAQGAYRFDNLAPGEAQVVYSLVNFSTARRTVVVPAAGTVRSNVVLQLALHADVTVTGKSTFTNLADVEDPAQNLVGIAQSASQGAITARQLDTRPIMRTGEVLETVPGMVISQHSGEGKANQYLLARVQPRSRNRFRHDGRGHPRESPDARAWPRLRGSQFPHSRARQRRAVLERTLLRGPGGLRDRRRRQHQLHEQPGASDRPRRRRR